MKAIKYVSALHGPQVDSWYHKRGADGFMPDGLRPPTGFIVPNYCAAWIYKTDSTCAFIQWIISNPDTEKEERNQALTSLYKTMVEYIEAEGYKYAVSFNLHPNLKQKCLDLGFVSAEEAHETLFKRF